MKAMRILVGGKEELIVVEDRECKFCKKLFSPKKFKSWFCSSSCRRKDYYKLNIKKESFYKDKIRHGGKREELIKENGFRCSKCNKDGNSYEIVAHHITFNNQDHSEQELLCRACHCRLHHSNEKKPVTREQIEEAIKSSRNLFEVCEKLGLNRSSLYQKRKKLNLL